MEPIHDGYSAAKALSGEVNEIQYAQYSSLWSEVKKTKALSKSALVKKIIPVVDLVVASFPKALRAKKHRLEAIERMIEELHTICHMSYDRGDRDSFKSLDFHADEYFAILAGLTNPYTHEFHLISLQSLTRYAREASLHELMGFYQPHMELGLTTEQIRDLAVKEGNLQLLKLGLTTPDFFKDMNGTIKYPPDTLAFLKENNLLDQNPLLEWQTAIESDHPIFVPTYTPTTEELEGLIKKAVSKRLDRAWNWLNNLLPSTLSPELQEFVWTRFLEDITRSVAYSTTRNRYALILTLLQFTEDRIRKDLASMFDALDKDARSDTALRLGYLRVLNQPMAAFMPESTLSPLIEMIRKNDRSAQAAHILTIIYLLQPTLDRKTIHALWVQLKQGGRAVLFATENVQLLYTATA